MPCNFIAITCYVKNSVTKTSEGTIQEERYTIIKNPGSQYVDHVTPDDGPVRSTASELISCIIAANSEDTLQAVICDGTAVNTDRMS